MLKPFLTILTTLLVISCSEPEEFKTLGKNVAGPIDITESATHFYVLNADIDRVYNQGSIMVLDTDGEIVSTLSTPRMGRFLVIRDDILIAGFGQTDQYETPAQIKFYDISNPENITLEKSITMDCSPVNAVSPSNYQYFAVSCLGGKIYMGTWGASLEDTELKFVRQPDSITRRALYIDTSRNLLLAFTTAYYYPREPEFRDARYLDQSSYDESFNETSGANEVPDNLESSQDILEALARSDNDLQYKFLVYDIASESAKGFPSIENDSPDAKLEMRWLYFESNRSKIDFAAGEKYYRSNFWMTLPHESDPNSFYISQRGNENNSPDSNAIFKFRITADPLPSGGQAPTTSSFLTVTAAYGYETEPTVAALQRFTHNFATATTNSQDYFVVNEFKDKSIKKEYFDSANYALGFQTTAGEKIGVKNNSDRANAYFAVGAIGDKVLAGSFYSNQLILFQVAPGSDIKQVRTIN